MKKDFIREHAEKHSKKGMAHIEKILATAKRLAKTYNEDILHAACYLHHIEDHHEKSAKHAEEFLRQHGWTEGKIQRIKDAIKHAHSRGKPKSVEGMLLHDAEILEELGISGLIRFSSEYGSENTEIILNSMKMARENADRLVLNPSKKQAAERLIFTDFAINELEKNI